jgi:hypothetical protein
MATWFDLDGAAGRAAVYISSGSDAPLTDPLGNLSNVKFHTSLAYPYLVYSVTGSITLPAVAANVTDYSVRNTLFSHGVGSLPLIEGRITSGLSRVVRLNGSVPVQVGTVVNGPQFPRVVHLGADSTYVYLSEYGSTEENGGWDAITLGWRVDVMSVASGYGTGVDITSTYFVCGPFDSRRRYMRADVSGADQPMTHAVTLDMAIPSAEQVHWRYAVAGYVQNRGSLTYETPYTLVSI